jgi:hypothetical protein
MAIPGLQNTREQQKGVPLRAGVLQVNPAFMTPPGFAPSVGAERIGRVTIARLCEEGSAVSIRM